MIAKPVVKGKFWVVEDDGQTIATIQATSSGKFVYVHDNEREPFTSIKGISTKYDIRFETTKFKLSKVDTHHCYAFPTCSKPFNQIWDVQRKLGLFTKSPNSRSLFCAGYFAINYDGAWLTEFCPKNLVLTRHQYSGPYKSQSEAQQFINSLKA